MNMRSMTEYEAELYIKAGYFPTEDDIGAIVDLQDVFGHQRMWAIYKWLYNTETSYRAEKLFRLIWNNEDVDRYIAYVDNMRKERQHLTELQSELAHLTQKINTLKKKVEKDKYSMLGEGDYYDDPKLFDNTIVEEL